jgi:hypothetical protein
MTSFMCTLARKLQSAAPSQEAWLVSDVIGGAIPARAARCFDGLLALHGDFVAGPPSVVLWPKAGFEDHDGAV